jgi:capsular polysaccharide biosynthesis protein
MNLHPISLLDIARRSEASSPDARIHHAHSMAPARVDVPALAIGARFLDAWRFSGRPARVDWRETFYDSMAPATFVLRDVIVHSSAGIIQIGNEVLYESLWHTDPAQQGYDVVEGKVALRPRQVSRLDGTHITVLAGGKTNYFHAMIEGVARLAMLQAHLVEDAASLLVTQGAVAQGFVLDRLDLPAHLHRRQVSDWEAMHVDTLIFPWTVHGDCDYHPCVADFFERIEAGLGPGASGLPGRVYVDRRGTRLRPLLNEDEVIDRLRPAGFVAVRPETLSQADQVRLFRDAEAIVAPHGAGLTNLGYCRPGTRVLELHMDGYVNWCFRRLAAVRGLRYDCVLGRAVDPWTDGMENPHELRWTISADHVAGAADFLVSC